MRTWALLLSIVIFIVDFSTKRWVSHSDWLRHYEVIDGYFRIRYLTNEGIAFGLLHSLDSQWKPIILSCLAVAALVLVLYYIFSTPTHDRWMLLGLGLLLGGIFGNFVDRLLHGHVVDFLEVHWKNRYFWPTFNVADSAITSGVFVILFHNLVGGHRPAQSKPSMEQ